MNNLIKAIKKLKPSGPCGQDSFTLHGRSERERAINDVIEIIKEAMEGKVLVPVEATKEMLLELTNGYSGKSSVMKLRYKAMLEKAK